MSETTTEVREARFGDVAVLTISNPGRRNAFTRPLLTGLHRAIDDADHDPAVRAIVLTGAGNDFCVGADTAQMGREGVEPGDRVRFIAELVQPVTRALLTSSTPTIAMVNGTALGAGVDLALACDFRVAARSATICEGYPLVGLSPGNGGAWLLPKIVGRAHALDLLLTAREVTGDEAAAMGLVHSCVPDEDLLDAVLALAARISVLPPKAIAAIKQLVNDVDTLPMEAALRLSAYSVSVLQSGSEHRDAVRAYRAAQEE